MTLTSSTVTTLVLIGLIAVLAPVISEVTGRLRVPDVVLELGLGMVVGPFVLDLAHPDRIVNGLSDLGLSFLMFLAGYELDLLRIRGRPLRTAGLGWLLSLGIAFTFSFTLVSTGLALDTLAVGLALTTTALGTLLPVLRDAGVLSTPLGTHVLSVGTVGEFGPIVAVALILTRKDPLLTSLLLATFVVIAVATALLATQSQPPRVVELLRRNLHSSAQLPVRLSVLLILVLIYLAFELGLDVLMGAFAAGIVVRLLTVGRDSEVIRDKLEAIGFGFLVPIFFVVSGIKFDLGSFIHHPDTLLRIPLFLALFLVVRGAPALLLYRRTLEKGERGPLALFSATGLPLIVVITTVGVAAGRMTPKNAAALVGAGMLSVLVFPSLGLLGLRRRSGASPSAGPRAPAADLGTESAPGA